MALIKKVGVGKKTAPEEPEEGERDQSVASPETRRIRSPGPLETRRIKGDEPSGVAEAQLDQVEQEVALESPEALPAKEKDVPRAPTLSRGAILQERYRIESVEGIGGMSVVYKGRDLRFKNVYRICAIKEMIERAPDTQTRAITLKNFEREASLLATLNHPAIPKIYDYFVEKGRIYLVMEYVEGRNLEDVLDESLEPLQEEVVVRWAIKILDVLSYLHNHRPEPIIFRDMKPSNVMVTPEDRLTLIDFGIARIFEADQKGTMIGTEGYSPPEQYRGVAEPRADIYALGATMHHLLSKCDPRLETPFTFHERPLTQLNPLVSPQLEGVIMKALEYDIRQRWSSAAEMRAALIDLVHIDVGELRGPAPGAPAEVASDRLLWTFQCEEEIRASPLVYSGAVYIGVYDNNLYALDADAGKFVWKFSTQGGVCSTAYAWERFIFFGSEDGVVYAVDAQSGKVQWNMRTGGPVRSSPRIISNAIYVGSDDQSIYALGVRRGEELWSYRTWGPVRSSAVEAEGSIVIGSGDGHIYALDARNGELQWKYRTGHAVVSTPATFENLIIVGSWDAHVYALDQRSGWPAWKFRTGHRVTSSPHIHAGRVYIGSADGVMYCLDARGGRSIWKFETGSFITSSPIVLDGRVYFGVGDGRIQCLDTDSGKALWAFRTGGPVTGSPVASEGVIYIGSLDKKIYALQT